MSVYLSRVVYSVPHLCGEGRGHGGGWGFNAQCSPLHLPWALPLPVQLAIAIFQLTLLRCLVAGIRAR